MLSNSSPRSCCILHSHKQCMRVPIYLHPKSIEKCGTFGFFANVMGKKRVSQYNLNLYFSYPELNWIFFHMFKGHLHFVSLLIFSPFFSRVFGFFFLKVLYMPGMIINGKYFSFFFFLLCSQRPPQSFPFNLCTRIYESFTLLLLDFWVTVKNIFFFISRIWRNSPHSLLLFVWIHFFDSFEIVVWCEELNNFFDLHYLFE